MGVLPRTYKSSLLAIAALIPAILFGIAPAWGQIGIDATISKDQGSSSRTIASPAFSTTSANELLLAFVSTDYISGSNTTVTGVSGAGLTWALVVRTNAQSGTAEIWRAFAPSALAGATVTATLSQPVASSLTVMTFTGQIVRAQTVQVLSEPQKAQTGHRERRQRLL
jgi:hypothetical protein